MVVNVSLVVTLEEVIAILNLHNQMCVFWGKSENGLLIQDYLDHGASEEPMNPRWERILRFL